MTRQFRHALLGSAAALTMVSWSSVATATIVDFSTFATTPDSPASTADVVINADLSLRAITNIATSGNAATGHTGVVHFINGSGVGVRDIADVVDKKTKVSTPTAQGSAGISGEGGDQEEALLFLFSAAVAKSSLKITLNDYAYSTVTDKKTKVSTSGWFDDELLLIIKDSNGDTQTLTSAQVEATFVPGASDEPVIDLSLLALNANIDDVKEVYLEGYEGHFVVKSVDYTVKRDPPPTDVVEPSSLALLGLGLSGLGLAARRRRQSSDS